MRRTVLFLLALIAFCSQAEAALPGLADVLAARRLLSVGTWSRVLRIERTESDSVYPKSFYGLVFEMASALWLYAPQSGTQSLSTHLGRTGEDKAPQEMTRLLGGVFRGMRAWREEEHPFAPAGGRRRIPRNACFIESLALLDERMRQGACVQRASLFSLYYAEGRGGEKRGHTVLLYEEAGGTYVLDPADAKPQLLSERQVRDHHLLAADLAGGQGVRGIRELGLDLEERRVKAMLLAQELPRSAVATDTVGTVGAGQGTQRVSGGVGVLSQRM